MLLCSYNNIYTSLKKKKKEEESLYKDLQFQSKSTASVFRTFFQITAPFTRWLMGGSHRVQFCFFLFWSCLL